MTNLILHIPHSSDRIPLDKGYLVDKKILDQEIIKLTDWYTDELFFFEDSIIIRADFSRIFCDTERISEDNQEVMAQYGMGVLYEKLDDASLIREVNPQCKDDAIRPDKGLYYNFNILTKQGRMFIPLISEPFY